MGRSVLHLSTWDRRGGAARAALRLVEALRNHTNWDVRMLTAHAQQPAVFVHTVAPEASGFFGRRAAKREKQRRKEWARARDSGLPPFSLASPIGQVDWEAAIHTASGGWPDLIHLHWVADFLDYEAFFALMQKKPTPVLWTLHDLNPFTGGCHYAFGCDGYRTGCATCPQLPAGPYANLAADEFKRKKGVFDALPADRLHFLTPSRWLTNLAESSALVSKFPVATVPNGLDLEEYAPRAQLACRRALGLPEDGLVLCYLAGDLNQYVKGFDLLLGALQWLRQQGTAPTLLVCGQGEVVQDECPCPVLALGQLDHPRLQALAYSAADLFVLPSREDNLPNTMLEALACGTPLAAFAVGGIPDAIVEGETGFLAEPDHPRELAQAILRWQALTQEERLALRENCRALAEREYAAPVQARRMEACYRKLLGQGEG